MTAQPLSIPFFKPHLDDATIHEVVSVLRSGWLTTGPKTAEFEEQFKQYVHAPYGVMVNSCTAALHLALVAMGIGPGDEVITSTYTFVASLEVIEYVGATPVLVDVEDDTLNLSPFGVEQAITERTKAIIPVHFAGHPCDMDSLLFLAKQHDLVVIEDAAHCTPAFYKDKSVGSLGDITCFSFYANKCITTGEGGMLTTKHKNIADKVRLMRLHGMSKDAINRYQPGASWKYNVGVQGYKYNPTDMSAAIGLHQLAKADDFWQQRRSIAQHYQNAFKDNLTIQCLVEREHVLSSWHIFPIRLRGEKCGEGLRSELIEWLKQNGIGTSVHFTPLHEFTYYREKYSLDAKDYPCAHQAGKRVITLPLYPGLSMDQVDRVIEQVTSFLA